MNEKQERLIEKAEELGWSCHIYDDGIEFEKGSPAGEDFIFSIEGKDIEQELKDYAFYFNPEEHAGELYEAGKNGLAGVPGLRVLMKDADDIAEMLDKLVEELVAVINDFDEDEEADEGADAQDLCEE